MTSLHLYDPEPLDLRLQPTCHKSSYINCLDIIDLPGYKVTGYETKNQENTDTYMRIQTHTHTPKGHMITHTKTNTHTHTEFTHTPQTPHCHTQKATAR